MTGVCLTPCAAFTNGKNPSCHKTYPSISHPISLNSFPGLSHFNQFVWHRCMGSCEPQLVLTNRCQNDRTCERTLPLCKVTEWEQWRVHSASRSSLWWGPGGRACTDQQDHCEEQTMWSLGLMDSCKSDMTRREIKAEDCRQAWP